PAGTGLEDRERLGIDERHRSGTVSRRGGRPVRPGRAPPAYLPLTNAPVGLSAGWRGTLITSQVANAPRWDSARSSGTLSTKRRSRAVGDRLSELSAAGSATRRLVQPLPPGCERPRVEQHRTGTDQVS